MKKIIIAVDPAGGSETVIESGLELATHFKLAVDLVSIIDKSIDLATAATGMILDDYLEDETEKIKKDLIKIQSQNKSLQIQIHVESGDPKEDLMNYIATQNTSFIVMGTHGRSGFSHLFLGSTAEYVIRHAKVPTLVVPINKQNQFI